MRGKEIVKIAIVALIIDVLYDGYKAKRGGGAA